MLWGSRSSGSSATTWVYVAQAFARKYPDRLSGLFFFNCPYQGIGGAWVEPIKLTRY